MRPRSLLRYSQSQWDYLRYAAAILPHQILEGGGDVTHCFWSMNSWFSLKDAMQAIDAHLGCCEVSARHIRRRFWPFLQRRIFALRNAIPLPELNSIEVIQGEPHFLQISSLIERKNPIATLRGFLEVQRDFPKASFTIVGDGPLRTHLESFATEKGIHNFKIFSPTADIQRFYSKCNIFVLPSYREGLPYTLIEAAGRGIPIVASNIDGNPEIAVQDYNALLFSPNDAKALTNAMLRLARNPALRVEMGKKGLSLVERHFSISDHLDRLVSIYLSLIKR